MGGGGGFLAYQTYLPEKVVYACLVDKGTYYMRSHTSFQILINL